MNLTNHAQRRMQQRAIGQEAVALVVRYGRRSYDSHGGVRRFIDPKRFKSLQKTLLGAERKTLETARGLLVVQDAWEEIVITVAHRYRRLRHH